MLKTLWTVCALCAGLMIGYEARELRPTFFPQVGEVTAHVLYDNGEPYLQLWLNGKNLAWVSLPPPLRRSLREELSTVDQL